MQTRGYAGLPKYAEMVLADQLVKKVSELRNEVNVLVASALSYNVPEPPGYSHHEELGHGELDAITH